MVPILGPPCIWTQAYAGLTKIYIQIIWEDPRISAYTLYPHEIESTLNIFAADSMSLPVLFLSDLFKKNPRKNSRHVM